jgi:hypothetical protein
MEIFFLISLLMPDHCNVEPKKKDISFNRFDRSNPTCLTLSKLKLFGDLLQGARYCDLKHKFRLQQGNLPVASLLLRFYGLLKLIVALLASNTEPTGARDL